MKKLIIKGLLLLSVLSINVNLIQPHSDNEKIPDPLYGPTYTN